MADLNPYQTPTVVETFADDSMVFLNDGLRRVKRGLYWVYYGIVTILLGIIGGSFGLLTASINTQDALAFLSMALMGLGIIGGCTAIFVGQLFCLAVPPESKAKGVLLASVLIQALGCLLAVVSTFSIFLPLLGVGIAIFGAAPALIAALCYASLFLFMVFVRRLNRSIGRELSARSAGIVLGLMMLLLVAYFGSIGFVAVGLSSNTPALGSSVTLVMGVIGMVILVLGLVTFIKYANSVIYTAKGIGKLKSPGDGSPGIIKD